MSESNKKLTRSSITSQFEEVFKEQLHPYEVYYTEFFSNNRDAALSVRLVHKFKPAKQDLVFLYNVIYGWGLVTSDYLHYALNSLFNDEDEETESEEQQNGEGQS